MGISLLSLALSAAAEPQELSELELMPDLVIVNIGSMLPDKDFAHLFVASKRFKKLLAAELIKRGFLIKYWQQHDIHNKILGRFGWVCSVAFCPDGKHLASAHYVDHVIRLWDVLRTGQAGARISWTYRRG